MRLIRPASSLGSPLMKRSRLCLLSLLVLLCLPATPAQAQDTSTGGDANAGSIERTQPKPPATDETAAQIANLTLQALGGERAWSRLRSLKMVTSVVEHTQEYTLTEMFDDGKYRREYFRYHLGWEHQNYLTSNGEKATKRELKPEEKPGQLVTRHELAEVLARGDYKTPFYQHAERGIVLTYVAQSQFAGRDVYVVDATWNPNRTERYYIDSKSFLPVAVRRNDDFGGKQLPAFFLFTRYKLYDGVRLPVEIEARTNDKKYRSYTVTSVSVNPDFPPRLFDLVNISATRNPGLGK